MNKKTIILSVAVIGCFLIIVTVALFFLYSGTGSSKAGIADKREYMLLRAVPADASAVFRFTDVQTMTDFLVAETSILHYFVTEKEKKGKMTELLSSMKVSSSVFSGISSCPAVLSIHDLGHLEYLLLIDAGRSGDAPSASADSLLAYASRIGLSAQYADAADYAPAGSQIRKRSLIILSTSEVTGISALRHLRAEISILDAKGVPEAIERVTGSITAIVPNSGIENVAEAVFSKNCRQQISFAQKFAGCTAFTVDNYSSTSLSVSGKSYSDGNPRDFINVFKGIHPSTPKVSEILPSYTISAASLPINQIHEFLKSRTAFAETLTLVRDIESAAAAFTKKTGISPQDWAIALDIKEIASASFSVGGKIEKIILANLGNKNIPALFKGNADVSSDNCKGKILSYAYDGYISHLFGKQFMVNDGSNFILEGDWLIVGSRTALAEYVSGRATDYTLAEYFSDAGVKNCLGLKDSYFASYFSLTEDSGFTSTVFTPDYQPAVKASAADISLEPAFFTVRESKAGLCSFLDIFRTVVTKSQAPAFERDTEVEIPKGPFRVKNSGTGKMNLFYQQENLYLCLQEEDGKGLWGVPFKTPICGCAQTVDFYANGKLQILFASGSKLWLIDRLGRFVSSFPVELGKEVLLGPDVYDFSGKKKYNVMVLHTDNTIDMYNLHGRKPAEWKGITASETIKGLPERIRVGGNTYWVVRTSIQTLIFKFYGGEPLTVFSGDKMIRPDSEVTPSGDNAVDVMCYDGKKHTIKLTTKKDS